MHAEDVRTMALEILLLGPPRIERDGVPIVVDTRKAIALLARLAIEPGAHARDALAAWLWPESDQQHARAALRRTLSTLAGALGEGRLAINRDSLEFCHANDVRLDYAEFVAGVRLARGASPSEPAVAVLERCAALYRDDFLVGFSLRDSPEFDEWQLFQAETLRRDMCWVLERIVTLQFARGAYAEAIAAARRWLAFDPLHEPAHRMLMQSYVGAGEHAAALNQYRQCVRLLEAELGVAPLEETTALYEAIRERRHAGPPSVLQQPGASEAVATRARLPHLRTLPMVGRAAELNRLVQLHREVRYVGRLIAIEGEAGIGKTRLTEAFIQQARAAGSRVLHARCYDGEGDLSYGPLVELMRSGIALHPERDWHALLRSDDITAVARLSPELEPLQPRSSAEVDDGPGARTRFYSACARLIDALAGGGACAGVLVLEDVHWADDATLAFLSWLVHRLDARPLVLLLTWRTEETPPDHLARRMLAGAERDGRAERIALERLNRSDVAELVANVSGDARLAERLYQETEGLPYFVVEYLTDLADRGCSDPGELEVPRGVRDILRSRVARVGDVERQLLSTGAAIGRSFDFETLRAASGRGDEEVVAGIERLLAVGLLTESVSPDGSARYDFNHERLRAFVYSETSLARQRLLHRRIGEALAARSHGSAAQAGLIAYHFRLGGRDEQAAAQFRLAGLHARGVFAHQDALTHFEAALALGYPDPAELHQTIGDLHTLLGNYAAARTNYEAALAWNSGAPAATVAALEHRIALLYQRRGEWERSESHFRAAVAGANDTAPELAARALADWSLSAHRMHDSSRAVSLARRALDLARQAGDDRALAQAWNVLGMLARAAGDTEGALFALSESRHIAEQLGDRSALAAALNNLALVHTAAGLTEQAIALTEEALAACIASGDRHREAAILNNLADLYHASGRTEESMAHLKSSVMIYAEIGTIEGEPQPEIWKLVAW